MDARRSAGVASSSSDRDLLPLAVGDPRRHAIKFGYANSAVTKHGNDFNQFLMSYQVLLK